MGLCKVKIVTKYASDKGVKEASQTLSNMDGTATDAKLFEFCEKLAEFGSREFVECFKITEEQLLRS
ncbi:hypothetical protein AN644_00195 [Candidatus Epulonipiscium fishelsonii]|nr:hypothetical protein AN644_00195 [Epulopiscium sp. SCG-C06WGA-EpuloA1]